MKAADLLTLREILLLGELEEVGRANGSELAERLRDRCAELGLSPPTRNYVYKLLSRLHAREFLVRRRRIPRNQIEYELSVDGEEAFGAALEIYRAMRT